MTKFTVIEYHTLTYTFEVEAETAEQAVDLVNDLPTEQATHSAGEFQDRRVLDAVEFL